MGMGLNLANVDRGQPESAQLSLAIGNNESQPDLPIELKRGGEPDSSSPDPSSSERKEVLDDEDFDYKGTSRKQYENAMFNRVCSMILDDFLYLGSDLVAQNYDQLKENGITHVVNCAADYSADYHEDKGIKYLSLHLKDHVRENIENCFYDVIAFMDSAKKESGKVFVHCVQGISRSTTMVLCYMIFKQKISLDDGLSFIRERRQIANPNMTFMA